jgi:hypothetical protein
MNFIFIVLFFVVYNFFLSFLFQQLRDTKAILYLKTRLIFSAILFGILIPILILLLIYEYDNYKNLGFIVALSLIYTKFFFNYGIFKKNN